MQWVGHAERTCDRDERQALGPSDPRNRDENRARAREANERTRERRNTERGCYGRSERERKKEDAEREWNGRPACQV